MPLSVTLPVDEPSCSVSDPVPEIAPVTVIVPLLVRMDRELAATARAVAVTFPEPVLILLLPVTLAAVSEVRLAPETAPKSPLQVPEVMVPVVTRLESVVMDACVAPVTVAALHC